VLGPRERRYLTLYLPMGIVVAVLIDLAAFAAIGGPFPSLPEICAGCPSSTTPLGTALTLGSPREASAGAHYWYNFTVQSAGAGIVLGNVQVQLVTATGPIGAGWTLEVLGGSGEAIGHYVLGNSSWSSGVETPIVTGQTFVLDTGPDNLSGQGAVLDLTGTGAFDGTINVEIP
jgi:hypothetical protein